MRTSIKVKRAVKKFLIENDQKADKRWKSRKAQKGLLIIAGTIAIITIGNILINIAQAAPESLIYENKHIDFGTGIETESAEDTPEHKDEAEDGIAVNSISQMIAEKFPEESEIAIAVAKSESSLDPKRHSDTDRMADGRAFSIGLMQINLTVHKMGGKDCYKAFSGKDYKAKVVNEELYQECVKLAENPELNLEEGRGIYERSGNNFGKWGGYTSGAHLKHM